MAKKVFIGVGHGGSDPGAVANGLVEKDLNLVTALKVNEELVRHGVVTLMSRTKDENDDLHEEIRECNSFDPDLAVDIHHNAGRGDGAEAFHHYGGGTGKKLAQNILKEIVALGQNSRGAKTKRDTDGTDWYGFIRETYAPAVIVECAFLDSKDHEIVDTKAENEAMGVAIAKGILETLSIQWVSDQKKQIVLGEYETIREADNALGDIYETISSLETAVDNAKTYANKLESVLKNVKVVG